MAIDLRACLNAISDVVNNRPRPLREFDQIFMKTADMLLQTEHVGRLFEGKQVVFIGDGDAIGLCLVHLHSQKLLEHGPKTVRVLDFDERVILSIRGLPSVLGSRTGFRLSYITSPMLYRRNTGSSSNASTLTPPSGPVMRVGVSKRF